MLRSQNGIGEVFARMEGFDSTLLTWVASPPFAAGGAGSTQVSVSSAAGRVTTDPFSTSWGGNAGFHFDSSGALNIAGTFSASTTVNVSSAAGRVTTDPFSTSWGGNAGFHFDSSGALNIAGTFSASTTVNVSSAAGRVTTDPFSTSWGGNAGFHFDSSGALLISGATASTQVSVSSVAGVVNVQQNSTVWAVQLTQYSTIVAVSSVAGIVTIAGNSTVAPLAGSTWNTRPLQSSAADLQMTATPLAGSTWNVRPLQSSAADLQVTCTPLAGSTWNVRALNSSAGDLLMTATIGLNLQSTSAPSSGSSGLIVRVVQHSYLSAASSNAFIPSTSFTIQSSVAGVRTCVYAYSMTTTNQTPTKVAFFDGATMKWPIILAAISSAVAGVNLAVSPPAFLFQGSVAAPMTLQIPSSIAGWKVGVSYFQSP